MVEVSIEVELGNDSWILMSTMFSIVVYSKNNVICYQDTIANTQ